MSGKGRRNQMMKRKNINETLKKEYESIINEIQNENDEGNNNKVRALNESLKKAAEEHIEHRKKPDREYEQCEIVKNMFKERQAKIN